MTDISYSIDETKLMIKLERYKRRWKEQRHYSEYLKCKLAKKALQNYKLKERLWKNNCGMADRDAEIKRLNATIDRTVNAWESRCIEKYDEIKRLNIVIDELIEKGFTYNQQQWSELVHRIQKEREE
jgi:hypothetical protein